MKLKVFLWLVLLALLWGPSFLFIKVAVAGIPPITLAATRVALAALMVYAILKFQRRSLPGFGPLWKHFAVMGFFSNALPFTLLNWGEQYVDSALAAILIGTTPIFTILLAHFISQDDRLTPQKMLGILLGFGGLVFLFGPTLLEDVQATTWGLVAATGAAFSYGVAIVYGRQYLRGLPPLVGPTAQLATAAVFLLPLAVVVENPLNQPVPSWTAISALLALTILCTVLAYIGYYRVMEFATATSLSMITYMVPIVAMVLGVVVLNEQLGASAYVGCGLILLAIMIVNGAINPIDWLRALSNSKVRKDLTQIERTSS